MRQIIRSFNLIFLMAIVFGLLSCQKDTNFDYDQTLNPDIVSPIPDWNPDGIEVYCADVEVRVDMSGWLENQEVVVNICNIGNARVITPYFIYEVKLIGGFGTMRIPFSLLEPNQCRTDRFSFESYGSFCGVEVWVKLRETPDGLEQTVPLDCNLENNHVLAMIPTCIDIDIDG